MADSTEFSTIYRELRLIYRSFEKHLVVLRDEEGDFFANSAQPWKDGRELFFGSISTGNSYVSFHLMPLNLFPDLLDGISDGLRKRMQGKSCFNFATYDRPLNRELATLTKISFLRLRNEGYA